MNAAFVLGSQRCGSTLFVRLLDRHSSIRINRPVRPEPKFFLKENYAALGLEYYLSTYFGVQDTDFEGYLLEKSTSYVEHPYVINRIKTFFPSPKLLIILRHPVIRAISNYKFSVENGLEPRTPEEVFLQGVPAPAQPVTTSVFPFAYLERSNYPAQLQPFQKEDIHYVIFEKLLNDPQGELAGVFSYLELPAEIIPLPSKLPKINASQSSEVISEQVLEKIKEKLAGIIEETEKMLDRDLSIWRDML